MRFIFHPGYTLVASETDPTITKVFVDENGEYFAERRNTPKSKPFEFQLSIKRKDGQPIRNWRLLQDVKNAIAGFEREAVERYPPEAEVTDTANIYHLWVFREGCGLPVQLTPPPKEA